MLSFREFVDQSDHSFHFKDPKQRQKELNVAADKAKKKMLLNKKKKDYTIDNPSDPATMENMVYIGDALGMDNTTLLDAIEMNQHLMATSEYREQLKKHFGSLYKKGGKVTGQDFRKLAKLMGRFTPREDKNGNPQDSLTQELLDSVEKEREVVETIATKALNNTSILSKLWNGVKWVGSKIMDFFKYIFTGLEAISEWALHHPKAAAVIILICLAIMCYLTLQCSGAVYNAWVSVSDWVTGTWGWRLLQSFWGTNTDFVMRANKIAFRANYTKQRGDQLASICDKAAKLKAAYDLKIAVGAAATGVGIPVAAAASTSSFFTYMAGTFGCQAAGYGAAIGIQYFNLDDYDLGFDALKSEALAAEREQLAEVYKYILEYVLQILGWVLSGATAITAAKWLKGMDKLAAGGRALQKMISKKKKVAIDTMETVIGLDKKLLKF